MRLYFSHEIRGPLGDNADPDTIEHNVQKALQRAAVLKEHFPMVQWEVPHEWWIVNDLWADGILESEDILAAECKFIKSDRCDGVVAVGEYHSGTGVEQEVVTAHMAGKLVIFMEDVDYDGRKKLGTAIRNFV